MVKKVQGAI